MNEEKNEIIQGNIITWNEMSASIPQNIHIDVIARYYANVDRKFIYKRFIDLKFLGLTKNCEFEFMGLEIKWEPILWTLSPKIPSGLEDRL